ncbi:MAG: aspartate kinase, partial [Clostridia bacterium]|nr:aspartate kinase [Clostridia bacterium]
MSGNISRHSDNFSLKVAKFGGSSLSDGEQFGKVRAIVLSDPQIRFVIPSAPGKRFNGDSKVTDMLYECYNLSSSGEDVDDLFSKVTDRYNSIISELGLELDLTEEYLHIKWAITHHAGRDYAASRGEYLNGKIL